MPLKPPPTDRVSPRSGDALLRVFDEAVGLYLAGRVDEAQRLFREIMRKAGKHHRQHYRVGKRALASNIPRWAYDCMSRAIALAPHQPEYYSMLARALMSMRRTEEALAVLDRALELQPDNLSVLLNRASAQQLLGRKDDALASLDKAVSQHSASPIAHDQRGILLNRMGRNEDALDAFERALAVDPARVNTHINRGVALRQIGRRKEALASFDQALALAPRAMLAHYNRGLVLHDMEANEQALAAFDQALEVQPDHIDTWFQKALILELYNRLDEAQRVVEQGRIRAPHDDRLALIAARLANRNKKDSKEALRILQGIQPQGPARIDWHFEQGICRDRLGDTENAFSHFAAGNRMQLEQARNQGLDEEASLKKVRRLLDVFQARWVAGWSSEPDRDGADLVFLVGFPRSGTTLLDQILSSHPSIGVIEEKRTLTPVFGRLGEWNLADPATWDSLDSRQISELQDCYLQARARYLDGEGRRSRWIDKMPLRSIDAGLIHRLFPRACFLFALRHPCDAVLSCLMQQFKLNAAMANFSDRDRAVVFYSQVMTLWEQYERVLPLHVHYVRYEDVVGDLEAEARRLLAFLGVEWNDRVLDYTRTARARKRINTPSYRQVTESIYQHAKYRWQRYRAQLEPCLERLAPHAERFGYGDPRAVR